MTSPHPGDDTPDADWLEQHGTDEDTDQMVSADDSEADPADRLEQSAAVPDDDEDDYARD